MPIYLYMRMYIYFENYRCMYVILLNIFDFLFVGFGGGEDIF